MGVRLPNGKLRGSFRPRGFLFGHLGPRDAHAAMFRSAQHPIDQPIRDAGVPVFDQRAALSELAEYLSPRR